MELSCHGGLQVPARLLAALQAAGARPAAPGEFTRRAVLNGKLDLVQAEAVGDLIDATAPAQAQAALHQLEGGLSRRLATLRESLLEVQALLSYDIDFPEEDDGPVSPERMAPADRSRAATRSGCWWRALRRPSGCGRARCWYSPAGPTPGSPRSSTLCSAAPGHWSPRSPAPRAMRSRRTPIFWAGRCGWPIPPACGMPRRRSTGWASRSAAAIWPPRIWCCSASSRAADLGEDETAIAAARPTLLVRTKADLADEPGEGLAVSVVTGEGLGALRRAAAERVFADRINLADLEPALTRERHRTALARAQEALAAGGASSGPRAATRCWPRTTCARPPPRSTSCSARWISRRCWTGCLVVFASGSESVRS